MLPYGRLGAASPPTLELNAAAFAVVENAGPLVVRVVRRGDLSGVSTVSFTTSNGTAVAGVDFTAVAGVLTFPTGESNQTFVVSPLNDSVLETNRMFRLQLFDPANAVLGPQSNATVTLVDDEFFAVLDPGFDPGRGADNDIFTLALRPDGRIVLGGQFLSFNQVAGLSRVAVLLPDGRMDPAFKLGDGVPDGPVYAVALQADGRMIIGGDFTAIGGTARPHLARLTREGALDPDFAPSGINNGIRAVVLQPDGRILIAGRFTQVSGQNRGRMARLNADGTIDGMFNPGVGANSSIRALALQPDGRILLAGQFTTFDGQPRNRIARLMTDGAVDFSFNPGTGTDDEVRSIAVQSDGEILIGGQFENYNGALRSSVARLFADGTLDPAFDPGPSTDDFVRVVALAPGGKVWIGGEFTSAGGAPRSNLALLGPDGQVDAFDPGFVEQQVFAILTQPDGQTLVGGDFISINGISLRRIARFNTGHPPAQLLLELNEGVADESASARVLTVLRQGDFTVAAQAEFLTRDGTARAGEDYVALAGTVRFEPQETAKSLSIVILQDSLPELPETFVLCLTNPVSPTILGVVTNTVITMRDDDDGFEFAAAAFAGSEPAGVATITVRRGSIGNDTVSVDYRVTPGTAQAGVDYFATNGTLIFQPGEMQKTFTVGIVADGQPEVTETVLLALTNASAGAGLGVRSNATLTIEDLDGTFEWGYVALEAEPGGSFFTVVQRSGVKSLAATVDFTTLDGTATAGADYVAVSSTLSFAPGQTYAYVFLTALNDGLVEGDETFILHLNNPTGGAVLGAGSNAVVTIFDNDAGLGFTQTNVVVSENTTSVTLTVRRYDDGPDPLSVEYFTSDGTARSGVNYVARSGTIHLPTALDSQTVTIPLLDECELAGERFFTVALRNPSPGGALGANRASVITVEGNDRPGRRDRSFPMLEGRYDNIIARADGRLLVGGSTVARLQPDGSFDPGFAWRHGEPFGPIVAVAGMEEQSGDRVLLLEFVYFLDIFVYYFHRLLPNGRDDTAFQPASGLGFSYFGFDIHALALAVRSDGRILVGGDITNRIGPNAPGLVQLLPDGPLDPSFDPGAGAFRSDFAKGVRALRLVSDGRILVGGLFTNFSGAPRNGLVRLQPDGTLDLSFDPGGGPTNALGPDVSVIRLQRDGKILIAGGFTRYNGVARTGLARVLANGALDSFFDPGEILGGFVRATVVQPNGKIVIGGSFTSVQGQPRLGLARLNPNGSLDLTFDSAPDPRDVRALALQPDGRIVVGSTTGLWRVDGDPIPRFDNVARQADGNLRLRLASRPGQTYVFQTSTNLLDWLPLQTRTAADCVLEFIDPEGAEEHRFYRAVQLIP